MRVIIVAVLLLILSSCSLKQVTGASNPAGNEPSAPAPLNWPAAAPSSAASTPQKDRTAMRDEEVVAEIRLRDGKLMKAQPSMGNNSYMDEPQVDRSAVTLICFPDCHGAPRESSERDLLVLKDGRRKAGEITWIHKGSYNSLTRAWEGCFVRLSAESDEEVPLSAIRYIKFSDQVFYNLRQALRTPTRVHRLVLHGDPDAIFPEPEATMPLKHLSAKLGRLTNLKELDIACLESLKDLPAEIGNLQKLEKLVMDNGNGCLMNIALPASIGQLKRLRVLTLYGAMSKRLPATLGNLRNLEELDLGHNGISHLPPQIASLKKLRVLRLTWGAIDRLPAFVGILPNLRELALDSTHGPNRPITLPDSLNALKGLKISMGNNYLKLKDQEKLRKRFPKVAFDFENEFEDGSDDANEMPPARESGTATKQ